MNATTSGGVPLFDDVFLDRLDDHALVLQPLDRLIDLGAVAVDLQRDEAHLGRHGRAADVEEDVEFFRELADERLLHQLLRKGEGESPRGVFFSSFLLQYKKKKNKNNHPHP